MSRICSCRLSSLLYSMFFYIIPKVSFMYIALQKSTKTEVILIQERVDGDEWNFISVKVMICLMNNLLEGKVKYISKW